MLAACRTYLCVTVGIGFNVRVYRDGSSHRTLLIVIIRPFTHSAEARLLPQDHKGRHTKSFSALYEWKHRYQWEPEFWYSPWWSWRWTATAVPSKSSTAWWQQQQQHHRARLLLSRLWRVQQVLHNWNWGLSTYWRACTMTRARSNVPSFDDAHRISWKDLTWLQGF